MESFAPLVTGAWEHVVWAINELKKAFGGLSEAFKKIRGDSGAVTDIGTVLQWLGYVLGRVFGTIIGAVVTVLEATAGGIILLDAAISYVVTWVIQFVHWLTTLPEKIEAFKQGIINLPETIKKAWEDFKNSIFQKGDELNEGIKAKFVEFGEKIKAGICVAIQMAKAFLKQELADFLTMLGLDPSATFPLLKSIWTDLVAIGSKIIEILNGIRDKVVGGLGSVITWLNTGIGKVVAFVTNFVTIIAQGAAKGIAAINAFLAPIVQTILGLGQMIIGGLIGLFTAFWNWFLGLITTFIAKIRKIFKRR